MNNIWITIVIIIVLVLGGYYLGQLWAPLAWIGYAVALYVVGYYIFSRNRRMKQ